MIYGDTTYGNEPWGDTSDDVGEKDRTLRAPLATEVVNMVQTAEVEDMKTTVAIPPE